MSVADARQSSVVRVDALIARVLENPALKEDALRSYLAAHRSHADELLTRLKDQSERMLVIDTASAEVLANALLWAAEHLDDARFRALGGIALGDVRRMPVPCFSYPIMCFSYPAETLIGNGDAAQPEPDGLRRMPNVVCFDSVALKE